MQNDFIVALDNSCICNYICYVTHPPSSLEAHIGFWLRCLSNLVSHSFAAKLEGQGVTVAQWVVLRTLYDSENLNLNTAAEAIGVDKSTLSRMIERLVEKGLVQRQSGPDRRSIHLQLSSAGKRLVPRLAKLADSNDSAYFKSLSPAKRREFLCTIKSLLAANGWDKKNTGKDKME